jgi:hypothetical protein
MAELPPPELVRRGQYARAFYTDIRVMAPLLLAIVSLFVAASTIVFCHRTSTSYNSIKINHFLKLFTQCADAFFPPGQARTLKETLDNQQNAEAQRERYYATIHKVALQSSTDKIPGNLSYCKHLNKKS